MHIEPTQGFDGLGSPDGPRNAPQPGQVPPAGRDEAAETPKDEQGVPPSYVERAAAAAEVRPDAVAEARRLLESGELDTPEAAAEAAETILTLGI
ncbi:MAG: hypothetical protein R6X20_14370 [Phycisphaerae bacterium]